MPNKTKLIWRVRDWQFLWSLVKLQLFQIPVIVAPITRLTTMSSIQPLLVFILRSPNLSWTFITYPRVVPSTVPVRATTTALPIRNDQSFIIESKNKSYKHQYASIYFVRLQRLRKSVEDRARKRWKDVAGEYRLLSPFLPRSAAYNEGYPITLIKINL